MPPRTRRAAAWALPTRLILASSLFFVANGASGQTSTSMLYVTVQVTNSCSFDATLNDLLSVTCSIETPMVTAVAGAPAAVAGGPGAVASLGADKSKIKLCNALASSILENGSFNQFAADIARKTQLPARYISTYQVCF